MKYLSCILLGIIIGSCLTSLYCDNIISDAYIAGWNDHKNYTDIQSIYKFDDNNHTSVGDINHIMIFDRVLNDSEIRELYISGSIKPTVDKYGTCLMTDYTDNQIRHTSIVRH